MDYPSIVWHVTLPFNKESNRYFKSCVTPKNRSFFEHYFRLKCTILDYVQYVFFDSLSFTVPKNV